MNRVSERLAARADARVFCIAGARARDEARLMRIAEGIRAEATPRSANILLIAGDLDDALVVPALVAHDALAPPRATLWWRLGADDDLVRANFPNAVVVDDADATSAVKRVHEELMMGERLGDEPLLPDVEPAPWRGIGPYGQGGKAMTGGVPYGRPMPERADDRDGLKLDYLPVLVGPLFAAFPVGLALNVRLHGDIVAEATVANFADAKIDHGSIFRRALHEPVAVRDLELARARSHLRWLSDAVAVTGPASLAERILRFERRIAPGDGDNVRALERALRRRGFFAWGGRGIGVLARDSLGEVSGPVARASGSAMDARSTDAAYRRLGFEPVVHEAGDVAARWLQRIREAAQALDLAERASDAVTGGSGATESPRGMLTEGTAPSAALGDVIPSLAAGMEWGEAVATIVSLDLDMAEAQIHSEHVTAS